MTVKRFEQPRRLKKLYIRLSPFTVNGAERCFCKSEAALTLSLSVTPFFHYTILDPTLLGTGPFPSTFSMWVGTPKYKITVRTI